MGKRKSSQAAGNASKPPPTATSVTRTAPTTAFPRCFWCLFPPEPLRALRNPSVWGKMRGIGDTEPVLVGIWEKNCPKWHQNAPSWCAVHRGWFLMPNSSVFFPSNSPHSVQEMRTERCCLTRSPISGGIWGGKLPKMAQNAPKSHCGGGRGGCWEPHGGTEGSKLHPKAPNGHFCPPK